MAKSLFEPKKVPTYAENIIKPGTGLKSAPVPVRQQSATRTVPKTQSIPPEAAAVSAPAPVPVTPPAPAPTPAPPAPEGETRAFFFDGATELTGSYPAALGSNLFYHSVISVTLKPAWSQAATGSFGLYSVYSSNTNEGMSVWLDKKANGYTYVGVSYISESKMRGAIRPLEKNLYSGSSETHLQIPTSFGSPQQVRTDGKQYSTGNIPLFSNSIPSSKVLNRTDLVSDFRVSVGGPSPVSHSAAPTQEHFSGSISNLIITPDTSTYYTSSPVSEGHYANNKVKVAYKFEGDTSATKGGVDLEVVGTETYVSSSI